MIQLASSTEPVFQVLVSRRHVVHRDSTTLAYWVECFSSLPLDPLVTLSSSHFTRGKIVGECDVTFEWYRTYIHTYIHTHTHTYIHTYIHTYVHTYMWMYVQRAHTYKHIGTCVHAYGATLHYTEYCMCLYVSIGTYVHMYSIYKLCTYVCKYTWSVINKVRTTYNSSVGCDYCWGLSFGNSFLLFLFKPPKIKFYLLSELLVTSQNI